MNRRRTPAIVVLLAGAALVAGPRPVAAQRLEVSITPSTISFPSSDPDIVPLVSAPPAQVTYRIRQNNNRPWLMTAFVLGDLVSGASSIPISNVTWVATPAPPFQNGTLAVLVAQTVASGNGNVNPARQGQITFRLANSWTYEAGIYTRTVYFTLSTP
jgi:hypothetical protein